MITLFTTCRDFAGIHGEVQRNAIKSWTLLKPRPEILLIGDENGAAETAKEFGCRHIRSVSCTTWGTPLISALFWTAKEVGRGQVLCYVNSDILLMGHFTGAVAAVQAKLERFLMVGPRWGLVRPLGSEFAPGWEDRVLKGLARGGGKRHKPTGLDYFAFTKDVYAPSKWPPLAVGRTQWDSWLVFRARENGVRVVDCTQAITVVHQDHGKVPGVKTVETGWNRTFARERFGRGYVWDAEYRLGPAPDYELTEAPGADELWARDVGWEDWK